ncbi:NAD-dependent epimerase/dehydratase family protein [Roseivirga pacifica]|uniref:NAD-dependent epimerase/dehydratase family protein n=1 Tax=Roseivirga pacifica TaxID=1267423 RepID=UPI00209621EB|nr:NAD(P)-dependent oxidoreductase [Roseivirga pacifica]MCO6357457.1 NAD-dependent epimerase/dehydratase family protein [Roseivirga pacifica]MCO6367779.1 NAD-dependent epimerase/dehydratase family protein [Roseivirga pacifica]MCO6369690.1 NAD-dependent epimerase/dehydratase family protein [Roseivirga pacifica]MCO6373544.1 NAD-dependent epimerase/dehydratase family protein [Roseivirga pacifica]MCO6377151.1 NAD-dependent epimerase/dehydratase family protein [Roseivirga pacifica]
MTKILITGYSGFLATNLRKLLSDTQIVGLARGACSASTDRVYDNLNDLFDHEPYFDIVFHLASLIPYPTREYSGPEVWLSNFDLTKLLVDRYLNAKFVFSSSISVYGGCNHEEISIKSACIPNSEYGKSKLFAENYIRANLNNYAIVRFSSIVGPKMKPLTFIPLIIRAARESNEITLWGDGSRLQNYIDVRDAAELLIALANNSQSLTTLGISRKYYSNLEVARIVSNYTRAIIKFEGEDNSKSVAFQYPSNLDGLGYSQKYTLDDTIKDMLK